MIAGRYRIVALLGKGGMGEVYRAEDLSLGQEVALKFLPTSDQSEEALERFRGEVRIARQISHPNVCRVYDIGQANNQIFLSMEYIDGEDLSSLLRRIGRLSEDKAIEIGRKICAGLAAAHSKGVLHRDLKPANIMLDGRGEVLITDFGLAGFAREINDVRSGTPAYMAPEQLAGKEVTDKSDIYSLGLVLYELFTGKRAFDGKTLEDVVRTRRDSAVSRPSVIIREFNPTVERAIMRCLEADPEARPASALAVSAALPGGDPLAAALAAGETPSPQLVAAAGDKTGVPVRTAVTLFSVAILGIVLVYGLGIRNDALDRMNLPYSPEVLAQKARDTVQELGYTAHPADSAGAVDYDEDLHQYVSSGKHRELNWGAALQGRLPLLYYWLRESPQGMFATDVKDSYVTPGVVDLSDPPPTLSGMVRLRLGPEGKLLYFEAVPPEKDAAAPPANTTVNWADLFTRAGLDITKFKSTDPQWNSLGGSDSRLAWTGTWPGTAVPLRVEAASYRGKPVFFSLIGEWNKPSRMVSTDTTFSSRALQIVLVVFVFLLLTAAALIAWRNLSRNRVDRQGTIRLAIVVITLEMALFVFKAHFVASVGSFGLFMLALSGAMLITASLTVMYLALEPYVRRHWPHAIISWSRLMAGKVRDPLVGRDLLIGTILGIAWGVVYETTYVIRHHLTGFLDLPSSDFFQGPRHEIAAWVWHLLSSVQGVLIFFFMMFVFRVIFRKPWLAALVFIAFWTFLKSFGNDYLWIVVPTQVIVYGLATLVLVRFGFVAFGTGIFVADLLLNIPLTTQASSWYFGGSLFVLLTVAGIAAWGFHSALAGQKLWKEQFLDY